MDVIDFHKGTTETHKRLLEAACRVVERHGYKETSIARVAEEAGIAIGSCYKYYSSRTELLEDLILWVMHNLESSFNFTLEDNETYSEYEERIVLSYFDYNKKCSYFRPILLQASIETPNSYRRYYDIMHALYLEALKKASRRGEFPAYASADMADICHYLMGIRRTLFSQHSGHPKSSKNVRKAISLYIEFVKRALTK